MGDSILDRCGLMILFTNKFAYYLKREAGSTILKASPQISNDSPQAFACLVFMLMTAAEFLVGRDQISPVVHSCLTSHAAHVTVLAHCSALQDWDSTAKMPIPKDPQLSYFFVLLSGVVCLDAIDS